MRTLIPTGYKDEIEQIDREIYVYRSMMPFFGEFRPMRVEFRLPQNAYRPEIEQVELGNRPDAQGQIEWLDVTEWLYKEQRLPIRDEIEMAMTTMNMADAHS